MNNSKIFSLILLLTCAFSLDAAGYRPRQAPPRAVPIPRHPLAAADQIYVPVAPIYVYAGDLYAPVVSFDSYGHTYAPQPYPQTIPMPQPMVQQVIPIERLIQNVANSRIDLSRDTIHEWMLRGGNIKSIFISDAYGRTPLHWAIILHRPDIASNLLTWLTQQNVLMTPEELQASFTCIDQVTHNTLLLEILKILAPTNRTPAPVNARPILIRLANFIAQHSNLDYKDSLDPEALSVRNYFTTQLRSEEDCAALVHFFANPAEEATAQTPTEDSDRGCSEKSKLPLMDSGHETPFAPIRVTPIQNEYVEQVTKALETVTFINAAELISSAPEQTLAVNISTDKDSVETSPAEPAAKKPLTDYEKAARKERQNAAHKAKQAEAAKQKAEEDTRARAEQDAKKKTTAEKRKEKTAAPATASAPNPSADQAFNPIKDKKSAAKEAAQKEHEQIATPPQQKTAALESAVEKQDAQALQKAINNLGKNFRSQKKALKQEALEIILKQPEIFTKDFLGWNLENYFSLNPKQIIQVYISGLLTPPVELLYDILDNEKIEEIETFSHHLAQFENRKGHWHFHGALLRAIDNHKWKTARKLLTFITNFSPEIGFRYSNGIFPILNYFLDAAMDTHRMKINQTIIDNEDFFESLKFIVSQRTFKINESFCTNGYLPLHAAAILDSKQIIDLFLDAGASPFALARKSNESITALDLCKEKRHSAAQAILDHPVCQQFVIVFYAFLKIIPENKFLIQKLYGENFLLQKAKSMGINLAPLLTECENADLMHLHNGTDVLHAETDIVTRIVTRTMFDPSDILFTEEDLLAPLNCKILYDQSKNPIAIEMIEGIMPDAFEICLQKIRDNLHKPDKLRKHGAFLEIIIPTFQTANFIASMKEKIAQGHGTKTLTNLKTILASTEFKQPDAESLNIALSAIYHALISV